ncbi:MAG: hypothetical protein AAFN77_23230 [Planctomycetota bacterium]
MSRKLNLILLIASLGITIAFAGCDLGTYRQRMEENSLMKNPPAIPDDSDNEPADDNPSDDQ